MTLGETRTMTTFIIIIAFVTLIGVRFIPRSGRWRYAWLVFCLINLTMAAVLNYKSVKKDDRISTLESQLADPYKYKRKEMFEASDKEYRMNWTWLGGARGRSGVLGMTIVYFELDKIPLPKSVEISTHDGDVSSASFTVFHNIIAYQVHKTPILPKKGHFYCIEYMVDTTATNTLLTVKNMNWVIDNKYPYKSGIFRPRLPQKIDGAKSE